MVFDEIFSGRQSARVELIRFMKHLFFLPSFFRLRDAWVTALFIVVSLQARDLAPYGHAHFFNSDHLVQVDLEIKKADWDQLRFQHRSMLKTMRTDVPPSNQAKQFDYFPAKLWIDGIELGQVAVRKKGFIGSMDHDRPSLKIKLDRFDKKKTFAYLDTLTLNNNKQDPSDLNQVIGFQIFRNAGLPAPRCNFALLTVNGKRLGVYCNIESPDKRFLRRQFGDDSGTLYEGTLADFTPNGLIRFERKFGNKKRDKTLSEITDILIKEDAEMLKALGKRLDLDQFYRYWALESLLGHWDGYASNKNNYFVYYDPIRQRCLFMPWGMDQLAEDHNMFWGRQTNAPKSVKADGALTRRLYQTEEGKQHYFSALETLLDTVWREKDLSRQIERLRKLIAPHREYSGERRRQTGQPIDQFIINRREQLQRELADGYPEWPIKERGLPGRVEKRGECSLDFEFNMVNTNEPSKTFQQTDGTGHVTVNVEGKTFQFDNPEVRIRKNRGWRGGSYTVQFSNPIAVKGQASTVEVTFPLRMAKSNHPIRLDVFASPGNGRLLDRPGNAERDQTIGMMAGMMRLDEFGPEDGDRVTGTVNGEFYQFLE